MVSVIINNYNYGRFISEAIESVIYQTYKEWELIIVDDGSTDNSIDIINKYKNKYPQKIKTILKNNGGQASCLNAGMSLASGEIIAFLDSDDYWMANKLDTIVEAHKKYHYVAHARTFTDGTKCKVNLFENDKRSYYLRKYGLTDTYDITTSVISISSYLAKQIFPIPEFEFKICADLYIKIAALFHFNVHYIRESFTVYRIHGNNAYVSLNLKTRSEQYDSRLDYISIEYINEKLKKNGEINHIPHLSIKNKEKLLYEIGNEFEIKQGNRYVVYGTGNDSIKMIRWIVDHDGEIIAFCDSAPNKHGQIFYSKKIWDVETLIKNRDKYDKVIIASQWYYEEIEELLKTYGMIRKNDYIYSPIF